MFSTYLCQNCWWSWVFTYQMFTLDTWRVYHTHLHIDQRPFIHRNDLIGRLPGVNHSLHRYSSGTDSEIEQAPGEKKIGCIKPFSPSNLDLKVTIKVSGVNKYWVFKPFSSPIDSQDNIQSTVFKHSLFDCLVQIAEPDSPLIGKFVIPCHKILQHCDKPAWQSKWDTFKAE